MSANKEKLQGVNTSEVFARMLSELPWARLQSYIQANANLHKFCTFGGHRLEAGKRKRFEKIIFREAEKLDFSDTITNTLFAVWYPTHEELHNELEKYFFSDEYKAYCEANKLEDGEYVLPEEKFTEFYNAKEQPAWKVLLCFSPLKFSDEQASIILDEAQGNEGLLEELNKVKEELAEQTRRNSVVEAELERLRNQQKNNQSEIQEYKKDIRNFKTDADAMQQRCDSYQAEIKRLNQSLQESELAFSDKEDAVKEESNRNLQRLQNETERLSKELANWQNIYEEQRILNRGLERDAQEAAKLKELALREKSQMAEKLSHSEGFADLLLSRIDWPKVGAAMKMTPTLRRNFNSLIRRLNYEEDMSLTIEGTLPDFWNKLIKNEEELIRLISQSNTLEVIDGDLEGFWNIVSELFSDVQINLEARLFMVGLLQELFFQNLDLSDLKDSVIPSGKK